MSVSCVDAVQLVRPSYNLIPFSHSFPIFINRINVTSNKESRVFPHSRRRCCQQKLPRGLLRPGTRPHLRRMRLHKHPLRVPEAPLQLCHVGTGRVSLWQNANDLELKEP